MSEWLWVVAVVAAFWAGQWWGERQALHDVARMIVEDILRWGPGKEGDA